jgi:hypothetical protein
MSCNEYDRLSQDVACYHKQLIYLVVLKKLHGRLDDASKRSANKVAWILAMTGDALQWHERHCSTCRQVSRDRDKQLQFAW